MRRALLCSLVFALSPVPALAQQVSPPPLIAAGRLTDEQIASVVERLAVVADSRYVDAEAGARMAKALRAKLAQGDYRAMSDPVELAARLSTDLFSIVPDVHLRVAYEPNRSEQRIVEPASGAGAPTPQPYRRIDGRSSEAIARTNFGFDTVQRLDGNIGYLKMSRFVPPDLSEQTARAALEFLANSDAVIVDLRGNIGGSPELVRYIISHFTGPDPLTLMTRYIREGDQTETMTTLGNIPGRQRKGTPLHVLVDERTASAAEMFAYFVKRNNLGTVYGATTSGAGQGGNMTPIGAGLSAFIPFTRIVDGPGWEGVGVRPDIELPADGALAAVHQAALQRLLASNAEPDARRERAWALELLQAPERLAADPGELARFEGRYGSRQFKARGSTLTLQGLNGREEALVRVGDTIFRTPSGRYVFEGPPGGPVERLIVETASGTRSEVPRE